MGNVSKIFGQDIKDAQARAEIEELKKNGVGGGGLSLAFEFTFYGNSRNFDSSFGNFEIQAVEWGDGTTNKYKEIIDDEVREVWYHEYEYEGEWTVRVYAYAHFNNWLNEVGGKIISATVGSAVGLVSSFGSSCSDTLKKVIFKEGVHTIGEYAFVDCTELTEVKLPEGLRQIEQEAFFGCSRLTEIEIPDSVTAIGRNAFAGCSNLKKVTFKRSEWLGLADDIFQDAHEDLKIYVPAEAVNMYKALLIGFGDDRIYAISDINLENGVGTGSVQQVADGVAEGFDFTDKNANATAADPTLTGTIPYGATGNYASAFGGKSSAQGKRSRAEGTTTIAKGNYSHAEGDKSVALGTTSHAQGHSTLASGSHSHTEGDRTIASAESCHAEGGFSHASGVYSHAEGHESHAEGYGSHAEGFNTYASGSYSHAEGVGTKANGNAARTSGYGTRANYDHQNVCGRYNKNKDNTLFEVGNGHGESSRSNAFEVLGDGRAKVQSAPQDDDDIVRKKELDDLRSLVATLQATIATLKGE